MAQTGRDVLDWRLERSAERAHPPDGRKCCQNAI